jgi:ABC-type transport system involved in cytochrome c biogenesis permease subunit
MNDREFLWLAQLFYAASVVLTMRRLRVGGASAQLHRWNFLTMVFGFVLHTVFMYLRGMRIGRCPLTNPFEVQVFLAWGMVVFYLLIGPSYRVSFLGAFTAPAVLALCVVPLLAPIDVAWPRDCGARSPWIEFHAATALLSCGAFALAAVLSVMYLWQERQLKARRVTPSFLQLPSVEQLDVVALRLIIVGFALFTVGIIGGFISYRIVHQLTPLRAGLTTAKIVWACAVWVAYALVLAARMVASVRGRKFAVMAITMFVFTFITFSIVNLLPKPLQP